MIMRSAHQACPCSFACDGARVELGDGFRSAGLSVAVERKDYDEAPASDWVLWFENTGDADTPLIEHVNALDITLDDPMDGAASYVLHRTNGAPSDPTDFAMSTVDFPGEVTLSAGGGRSSNRDFPFFRVDTGSGAVIIAVGWSGQWSATLTEGGDGRLRITAGWEHARFRLRPGERIRTPHILMLDWRGPREEANNAFRRLLLDHYLLKVRGGAAEPFVYCNTAFTRKGQWLNECNEANQISLIRALEPLKPEGVITDAGWFVGGWPNGAGNWTPRREAYPNGFEPVCAAALECGTQYGLWFEIERVFAGTDLDRDHPDWVLKIKDPKAAEGTRKLDQGLADFGLPEVQNHFFRIIDAFMATPGFGCFRVDFNMNPLHWWRQNDEPEREGLTEIKYITGLYDFWDRQIAARPDAFRVGCASGGRRIDLESLMRFHVHQKSDYWFDNTADQASLFGLSQYLPNRAVMAPIDRLDDDTLHSVLPASLCLGWIADDPNFDMPRAQEIVARYRSVRRLLNGDWYPLTPYSRAADRWLASQYNRPDLGEGMALAFRREACAEPALNVALKGLDTTATYVLEADRRTWRATGAELMDGLRIEIDRAPGSRLIVYRKV